MAEFGFSDEFLSKHKDIKSIVDQATEGQWEMDKFLDAVKATKWWKSTSDAQRRYDVAAADNPGEVNRSVAQMTLTVRSLATRLGFGTADADRLARKYGSLAVRNGWSEEEIRLYIGASYRSGGNQGLVGQTRSQLAELAGNYGVKLGPQTMANITRAVLQGVRSVEDYQTYFKDQAKRQYSAIAPELDQGFTVREVLEPYIQQASAELGLNPATMDITDGKWLAAIQFRPKGENAPRTMTNDEWTAKLRTDTRYGYDRTQKGQQAASQLVGALGQAFGAMG